MARHLDHIIIPLRKYLAGSRRLRLPLHFDGNQLAPPLEVARLCGEALLRLQFFILMSRLNHGDYTRQLALWQQLIGEGGYVLDLVQRLELFAWLKVPEDGDAKEWAYSVYCIFLHSLHEAGNSRLFTVATQEFLYHHYLGLYPKSTVSKKAPVEQLRRRALMQLRKKWGLATELKESFVAEDKDTVEFSLRLKTQDGTWQILLTEQGTRLKPTRIAAYNRLLAQIEEDKKRTTEQQAGIV